MRTGIALPNQVRDVRPDVIPVWARQAEEAGFSSLGTIGRIAYPGVMDTVALASAAGATSTIGLLSDVILATTWPGVLLAKEAASIDGVSGGRFTMGIGVGLREDDFVAYGHGPRDRGARLDRDLEEYLSVWDGQPVGGGENPAVPQGTRRVPLMFGAFSPIAMRRMAKYGEGYIGATVPPAMAAEAFAGARAAWRAAGRDGEPRLIGCAYVAVGDVDRTLFSVGDYYAAAGAFQRVALDAVCTTPGAITDLIKQYTDLGADEVILSVGTDDIDDVARLADIVL
ncbi:LLM class flavin-dependent oxidoreductase [Actinoplanes sp. NBRC 103695]|uniref:LLM class flavin-dependent oxidoreductase n=1 Tax=Actinoplanes sp. NBRC 103695 TaxID=3032202 RepID=UPI0024A23876|nr:LLM class flavin-dependent oxidoreductase [Actinoplanes sp. NBRC 103695]GLY97317.1 luciferase [Actinoplanes sp. NBRC 103695]